MATKRYITIFFFLTIYCHGKAQVTDTFCNDNSYHVRQVLRGKTIQIDCDTAYILNKSTFKLLNSSYSAYQTLNDSLLGFFSSTDIYLNEYQKQVDYYKVSLDTMENYYNSLSDASSKLVSNTTSSLRQVDSNLNSINTSLDSAKTKIAEATVEIRKEQRVIWWTHLAWLGGGVAIGALIVAVTK